MFGHQSKYLDRTHLKMQQQACGVCARRPPPLMCLRGFHGCMRKPYKICFNLGRSVQHPGE
eukprot:744255-Amphidinium_carterae.1